MVQDRHAPVCRAVRKNSADWDVHVYKLAAHRSADIFLFSSSARGAGEMHTFLVDWSLSFKPGSLWGMS